jgi:sec-independent protein translocase protein TatC
MSVEKNFWEHLVDLKDILFKIVSVWLAATLGLFMFSDGIIKIVTKPVVDKQLVLHFLSPTDNFFFVMKILSVAGLFISSPVIFFLIWSYIAQALDVKEKKFILHYFISTLILAVVAICYGYFYLLPTSLNFLLEFQVQNTKILLTANEYVSFVSSLLLVLILVFQTPVLVFTLVHSNVVSSKAVKSKRKEIYFLGAILIAAFGSSDAFSLLLVLVPIIILFEGSLVLADFQKSKKLELEENKVENIILVDAKEK